MVEVMSVQPTSENRTVRQPSRSAAGAASQQDRRAERPELDRAHVWDPSVAAFSLAPSISALAHQPNPESAATAKCGRPRGARINARSTAVSAPALKSGCRTAWVACARAARALSEPASERPPRARPAAIKDREPATDRDPSPCIGVCRWTRARVCAPAACARSTRLRRGRARAQPSAWRSCSACGRAAAPPGAPALPTAGRGAAALPWAPTGLAAGLKSRLIPLADLPRPPAHGHRPVRPRARDAASDTWNLEDPDRVLAGHQSLSVPAPI